MAIDLGVHHLPDVAEPLRLFQLGGRRFPPLRRVDALLSNLPLRPTPIIGRDDDVATMRKLLSEYRLVTVTAAGGMGKTRAAIAVGAAELACRRDGVWFVDLTAVMTDSEVSADSEGYAGCCEALGDWDPGDALTAIGTPTLVLAGSEDPATPPAQGEQIASLIPGARLSVLEGAGHLANVEEPAAFNRLLLDHLTAPSSLEVR